jgi:predicted MFS family arabinose efflux permease
MRGAMRGEVGSMPHPADGFSVSKDRTRTLVLMIAVVGLLNADQNLINSTLGAIEQEFRVNDADIGLMSGLFTVLGAVVSLVVGYLSDRWNRKLLFLSSVLLSEVPCLLTAFTANWLQFFICRILTGFGVGASFPVVFSLLGDLYEEKARASAVAWMTTVMGIGQILGQLVGGYAGPAVGWRLPFVFVSVPTLAFLAVFALLVREPRRGAAEESIASLVAEGLLYPRSIRLVDYISLFRNRTNLLLFIQGILGSVPWGAIPLFIVKFLNEGKGLSVEGATTAFLLFGAGNVAGTILGGLAGGPLLRRGPALLPRFCAVTTILGAGLVLYLFIGLPGGSLLWTLILGFSASFFVSMTGANVRTMLLNTNVPENRGAIFSLFNLTDSVGTGIGKYVGGGLSVAFGLGVSISVSAAFWVPCAVLLAAAAAFFTRDVAALRGRMKALAVEMAAQKGDHT